MGRPKKDWTGSICEGCSAVGKALIKGNCRKCYGASYFKDTYSKATNKARVAYTKEWRRQHPDQWKALVKKHNSKTKWLLWKYGITEEQYNTRRAVRDGKCSICDKTAFRLVLDHDHKTGQIRDFICDRCNMFLGFLENTNPEVLTLVDQYLQKHGSSIFGSVQQSFER